MHTCLLRLLDDKLGEAQKLHLTLRVLDGLANGLRVSSFDDDLQLCQAASKHRLGDFLTEPEFNDYFMHACQHHVEVDVQVAEGSQVYQP